jgi:heat shock protein HslJ
MKRLTFFALVAFFSFTACNSTKKTSGNMTDNAALNGTWELNYITGPKIAFDGMYPDKKPTITFDVANSKVTGNTSCNNFNGKLNTTGNKINFNDPMAMTRMMCQGQGETTFMETLKKVDSWTVTDGNTLNLIMGDVAMMRFSKK